MGSAGSDGAAGAAALDRRGDAPADRLRPYVPRVVLRQLAAGEGALSQTVRGSVVFVDVSGFTKLSERLARRGREGAEHLADAIGGCFASLLGLAYGNGGSLLKFGGDALLLLFEGPGHVERAVRSAAGMRRTLREIGRIETGGARVTLRMSVGVHTGDFHFFLVGDSHREFLVTGPAASRVVHMEGAADAGEIVLSPEVCERLPSGCVGAPKGPGRLLARTPGGVSLAPDNPASNVDEEVIAGCLSVGLRSHVLAGAQAPEHRTVAVAFVHFDGTDELIEQQGLGAATAALEQLVTAVQAAADEYGVCFLASDVDADGGKLILTAGAPRVLEDDEERILLALRRIVESELPLPVRIGVNRGPVFAGDVGPHFRRTYTVMGDAVNLAARLMAKAPVGEVYASAGVLDRSATRFELSELEPFMVKGKAKPVQAWAVGPVAGRRTGSDDALARDVAIIGRDRELGELRDRLEAALAGEGGLVELVGEPGIGKSRLVEELREGAPPARRLRALCSAYTAYTPYSAWRGLLRDLLELDHDAGDDAVVRRLREVVEAHDASLGPWLPLLAAPLGLDLEPTPEVAALLPEFRQRQLHDAILRLLAAWAGERMFIEVDDAQHMDAASSSLLVAVLDILPQTRWSIVVTRRDVDSGFTAPKHEHARRVELGPLDRAGALALAEALTEDAPLAPHVMGKAAEQSAGNPQYLRDLLRAALDGQADELPDSVEAAAMARIDRLAPHDRVLVRRASVLGVEFELDLLAEVLEAPAPDRSTWHRLDSLFEVESDRLVRFRRAVVQEAAYSGLPFRVRRELHAAAGACIEQRLGAAADEAAPILSLHFEKAGDNERAWRYACAAAGRAQRQGAHADAIRLYRRALQAGRALDLPAHQIAEIREALGTAYYHCGELENALESFTAARRLLQADAIQVARLLHRQVTVAADAGRVVPGVRWARHGLRVLDGIEGREAAACRAALRAALASLRERQGRTNEAIELSRDAMTEAEQAGADSALAHACYILDISLSDCGRRSELGYSQRALEIYRRLNEPVREAGVLNNMGIFAYWAGRWDEAEELYEAMSRASLRGGDVAKSAYGDLNVGELLCDQGRLDEGTRRLQRARRIWRSTGYEWGVAFTTALLGRAAARLGRAAEADELLAEAVDGFRRLKVDRDVVQVEALRAEAHLYADRVGAALEQADGLARRADDDGWMAPLVFRVRGLCLAELGRVWDATAALERSLHWARARDEALEVALTLDALEQVAELRGEPGDADRRAERDAIVQRLQVVRLMTPGRRTAVREAV